MINPEQIPDEVVDAASKAFTDAMLTIPQPDPVRAAIAAALNAWPGVERHTFEESGSGDDYCPPIDEIFLPLPPQESPND